MNAYDLIRAMIAAGAYKLAEIQAKIKRMYLLGDIGEAQLEELMQLSVQGATADAERPETVALLFSLAERVAAIEVRLDALESGGDGETGGEAETDPPVYPEWKPWDGFSKDYEQGAIVSHNGKLWQSVFGGQNVWEPGVVGSAGLWIEVQGND